MAPPSPHTLHPASTPGAIYISPRTLFLFMLVAAPSARQGRCWPPLIPFLYRRLSDTCPHIAPVSLLDPLIILSAITIHSSSYYHHLLLLDVFFPPPFYTSILQHTTYHTPSLFFCFSLPHATMTRPPPFFWVLYSAIRICCPPPTHGRRGRPEGCGLGCLCVCREGMRGGVLIIDRPWGRDTMLHPCHTYVRTLMLPAPWSATN
ncbi:hypothetical protein FB451DRAFT_519018 [Mycena latifolia]|nr:hypothetical protein FB451DRAFT_519018 [Mycena latifolia]